jgi:formylglycine-generating enzyme required for sulfatase activity
VREDYRGPVRLPVGPLDVRVSAIGRRSVVRQIELPAEGTRLEVTLPVIDVEAGERLTDELRTGGVGPPLIVIPAGVFSMGRDSGPPSERPARRVTLSEPFAVTVREITVAEYAQFAPDVASGDGVAGAEASALPVTGVTFKAAVAYADWLTAETGHQYRLPSEAEWEYLAAAGATSAFSFGDDESAICRYANVADRSLKKRYPSYAVADCDDGFAELAPVGSFTANSFGVHDVHGNVAEWVVDCGMPAYAEAPDDGTPAIESTSCPTHGVRGGSWDDGADSARTAKRHVASSSSRHRGIRLVREL